MTLKQTYAYAVWSIHLCTHSSCCNKSTKQVCKEQRKKPSGDPMQTHVPCRMASELLLSIRFLTSASQCACTIPHCGTEPLRQVQAEGFQFLGPFMPRASNQPDIVAWWKFEGCHEYKCDYYWRQERPVIQYPCQKQRKDCSP
jgi:hypothetical protein